MSDSKYAASVIFCCAAARRAFSMAAAVVTYGFGAYERDYRKVFVAEARKVWKMKNGKEKASP